MLPKDTSIFASFHPGDERAVQAVLEQAKAAGWKHIVQAAAHIERAAVPKLIQQCGMFVVFLSRKYALNDRLMLEEFAYASVILRKPFLPVWLDSLPDFSRIMRLP
jgi:hypothetical protein